MWSVFHPAAQGSHIGNLEAILRDTDISLVSSRDGASYFTEPFGSALESGDLRSLRCSNEQDVGYGLLMDSAFSGSCQILYMIEYAEVPTGELGIKSHCLILSEFTSETGEMSLWVGVVCENDLGWGGTRSSIFKFVMRKDFLL